MSVKQHPDFIDELKWRGLFHQCTNEDGLREHLADPVNRRRRAYAGFDPTSDSLTIGNMIPMMVLVHFQRCGHEPVVVMGGGTGLIGDPSGKSAERTLMTEERVREHVEGQRPIFERLWRNAGFDAPVIVNNLDWLGPLTYLQALRDIGKHFSVNMMIQKDSVRERLHARDQGISYTEFSYMVLQSYDFQHLFATQGVTAQFGGSDQWGNIVSGADLIRRCCAPMVEPLQVGPELIPGLVRPGAPAVIVPDEDQRAEAFGLTAPLVTKSDGGKFGKTESGAVWMTSERTSPYAMYQFWLNTSDADAARYLKFFTLLPREEIGAIEAAHAADPGKREAQRTLAREATALIHGPEARDQAEAAARALFSGEIAQLPLNMLNEVFQSVPASEHDRALLDGAGVALVDLLAQTTLATSKTQARQYLSEASVTVNGEKVAADARVTRASLLHGAIIALRRGKKNWHVTRWV